MDFYLGADVAGLGWGVPVMVNHGRLAARKNLPEASAPWVCDSRGFTELSQHGEWTITPGEYAEGLERYADEVGQLAWASPQDWMCEPEIIHGGTLPGGRVAPGTGKSELEHQQLTIESVQTLRAVVTRRVKVIAVLQGYELDAYLRMIGMYQAAGIDLFAESVVGLGSVCRRQNTSEIHTIVSVLAALGLRLHGFGVKTAAVKAVGLLLESADSEAWSRSARHDIVHCGHGLTAWAQNCRDCALEWRDGVLSGLRYAQPAFALEGVA